MDVWIVTTRDYYMEPPAIQGVFAVEADALALVSVNPDFEVERYTVK